jgi:hypothetical protein
MALNSLPTIFSRWADWARKAKSHPVLQDASYPFPKTTPKFLGTIIQRFRRRGDRPAAAFQSWVDQLNEVTTNNLIPSLNHWGMLLSEERYNSASVKRNYCLAEIPDFNSLIAASDEHQTPVFALNEKQINQVGTILQNSIESRNRFKSMFVDLSKKILILTNDD